MTINRLINSARFWIWGAMHYPKFRDHFLIAILPAVWIRFRPYQLNEREVAFIIGFRVPMIAYAEPSYFDIQITDPYLEMPDIDWGRELQPF